MEQQDIEIIAKINDHLRSIKILLSELSNYIAEDGKKTDNTKCFELVQAIGYIEKNRVVLPKLVRNEVETVLKDIKKVLSRKFLIIGVDDFL